MTFFEVHSPIPVKHFTPISLSICITLQEYEKTHSGLPSLSECYTEIVINLDAVMPFLVTCCPFFGIFL